MHTTFEEKGSHYVHTASKGLCRHFRPSQQRPMRTSIQPAKAYVDISVMMFGRPKLGLSGNGQHKSTNRRLVNMPHERSHGVMRILENFCMQLPKALKIRAIKDIVPRGARCPQHPGFNRHGTIPPPPPHPPLQWYKAWIFASLNVLAPLASRSCLAQLVRGGPVSPKAVNPNNNFLISS